MAQKMTADAPPRKFIGRGDAKTLGLKESVGKNRLRDDPEQYITPPGLADAVNVALLLKMPLLITGEPGTGKTQLADRIAFELGLGEVLRFETKSGSESRDLFYEFDLVARLAAAQVKGESTHPLRFISYNALGRAILLAQPLKAVEPILPLRKDPSEESGQPVGCDFIHDGPRQTVVLIDEIDKASRDFPNDLLNEIEGNYFRIRELGNRIVRAPCELSPVVVMTSNSEKQLPEPFLRRCVYYHIKFPGKEDLTGIVAARTGRLVDGGVLLEHAVDFFIHLRGSLQRAPSTAELLRWVEALHCQGINPRKALSEQKPILLATASVLCKNPEDQGTFGYALENWTPPGNPGRRP